MYALNTTLFDLINAPVVPNGAVLAVALFLADKVIFLVAAALVWGWARAGLRTRSKLFAVGLAAVLGLAINLVIAAFWQNPRPFALGVGNQFLPHAPDSSFPSDHATILFAVGFGLFAARAASVWSWLALILAVAVAWSRIYVGVHWPLDMAGSLIVALMAACIARLVIGTGPGRALCTTCLKLYDGALNLAHIPKRISPRSHREG